MATLEKRQDRYRIVFRFHGKKFSRSIRTENAVEARSALARITDGLRRLELGILVPPPGTDVVAFLFSDGKIDKVAEAPELRSLKQLTDSFFSSIIDGAMENATLSCMRTHVSHVNRILGGRFIFAEIQLADIRRFVERRLKEKGRRGGEVSPVTVRKELNSLRTVWNWAREEGITHKALPLRGLKLPKTEEKLAFKTLSEVERRIARGSLTEKQEARLWDSVFLTMPDLQELLTHVKRASLDPVLYPLFAFAAYTGARRSEIIRSEFDDIDLDARTAIIREKKRVPGQISTRRVPLATELVDALEVWFVVHPGGNHTFALPAEGRKGAGALPLTPRQMHPRFQTVLKGTKWEHLRGWHVFRHSFCSNCAARGLDQRTINAWVGHQTEDMVKRYRHIIPSFEQAAIQQVFG